MFRTVLLAGAVGLLLAGPVMAGDYNRAASAHAARTWAKDAAAVTPQALQNEALNPQGPTLVANAPIPDTRANRTRFGQPLSRAGRMTAPIGD